MGLLRWLLSPVVSVFQAAGSMWQYSGDLGWHIGLRILATIGVFSLFLFFFFWAFMGFKWPLIW